MLQSALHYMAQTAAKMGLRPILIGDDDADSQSLQQQMRNLAGESVSDQTSIKKLPVSLDKRAAGTNIISHAKQEDPA